MRSITRKLKVTHKVHGELELSLSIPQAETLEEGVNWTGGEGKTLQALNWLATFRALGGIRSTASNPPTTKDESGSVVNETAEAFATRADEIAAEAQPSAGRIGPTNKEKLSFADEVSKRRADAQAKGAELSGEDLLAIARDYGLAG